MKFHLKCIGDLLKGILDKHLESVHCREAVVSTVLWRLTPVSWPVHRQPGWPSFLHPEFELAATCPYLSLHSPTRQGQPSAIGASCLKKGFHLSQQTFTVQGPWPTLGISRRRRLKPCSRGVTLHNVHNREVWVVRMCTYDRAEGGVLKWWDTKVSRERMRI